MARPKKKAGPQPLTLDGRQLQAVADLFATLSEVSRLRILQALQGGPRNVGELVAETGLKQANVSKQLAGLHAGGVISRRRDGNRAIYAVEMPVIFELCELVCDGVARVAADHSAGLNRRRSR